MINKGKTAQSGQMIKSQNMAYRNLTNDKQQAFSIRRTNSKQEREQFIREQSQNQRKSNKNSFMDDMNHLQVSKKTNKQDEFFSFSCRVNPTVDHSKQQEMSFLESLMRKNGAHSTKKEKSSTDEPDLSYMESDQINKKKQEEGSIIDSESVQSDSNEEPNQIKKNIDKYFSPQRKMFQNGTLLSSLNLSVDMMDVLKSTTYQFLQKINEESSERELPVVSETKDQSQNMKQSKQSNDRKRIQSNLKLGNMHWEPAKIPQQFTKQPESPIQINLKRQEPERKSVKKQSQRQKIAQTSPNKDVDIHQQFFSCFPFNSSHQNDRINNPMNNPMSNQINSQMSNQIHGFFRSPRPNANQLHSPGNIARNPDFTYTTYPEPSVFQIPEAPQTKHFRHSNPQNQLSPHPETFYQQPQLSQGPQMLPWQHQIFNLKHQISSLRDLIKEERFERKINLKSMIEHEIRQKLNQKTGQQVSESQVDKRFTEMKALMIQQKSFYEKRVLQLESKFLHQLTHLKINYQKLTEENSFLKSSLQKKQSQAFQYQKQLMFLRQNMNSRQYEKAQNTSNKKKELSLRVQFSKQKQYKRSPRNMTSRNKRNLK